MAAAAVQVRQGEGGEGAKEGEVRGTSGGRESLRGEGHAITYHTSLLLLTTSIGIYEGL